MAIDLVGGDPRIGGADMTTTPTVTFSAFQVIPIGGFSINVILRKGFDA